MPYPREKQREYARTWRQKRHDDWFKDKKCVWCGSVEELELDHINPEEKVSHKIWSWAEERRLRELAKCQILCRSCHQKKHPQPRKEHGSYAWYNKRGCRCEICKTWMRDRRKLLRSLKP